MISDVLFVIYTMTGLPIINVGITDENLCLIIDVYLGKALLKVGTELGETD